MSNKALIVVDMQNDFVYPDGALYVKGAEKLVKKIESLIEKGNYDLIVVTRDWHPKNHYSFRKNGGQWPEHCVQNTKGAEFAIKIDTNTNNVVDIVKGDNPNVKNDYSGFNGHAYGFSAKLRWILWIYKITDVDVVLLMSVNPGFGGQKFIDNTYTKIKNLKDLIKSTKSNALIEVDGGITLENAPNLVDAGVNVLVAGSTIFGSSNPKSTIEKLKQI